MRSIRLAVLLLIAAAVVSSTACTNPTGPKPAGEESSSTKI